MITWFVVAVSRTGLLSRVVGAVAIMLLLAPMVNARQTCVTVGNVSDESTPGNLRVQASTTAQSSCNGRTVQVFARISGGVSYTCTTQNYQSYCYDIQTDSNAITQAYRSSYGTAGYSTVHKFRDGDVEYQDIAPTDPPALLNAGEPDPEEACEAAYNNWIEPDGPCEYNPDGEGSPIVIATGGDSAYKLTSAAQGVLFDLNSDGALEWTGWTEADSEVAFLALDRDGDGRITSGRELFGNFTLPGVGNGFAALRRMNLAENGGRERASVSSEDPLFARLLLWTDRNHNGISEPNELRPVGEKITDIGLSYSDHKRRDGHGNEFRYMGWVHVRTAPGRNKAKGPEEEQLRYRQVYDVFFTRK